MLLQWVSITLTATGGANALLYSVPLFLGRITLADVGTNPLQVIPDDLFLWFMAWIVLFAAGWPVQYVSTNSYAMGPAGRRAW